MRNTRTKLPASSTTGDPTRLPSAAKLFQALVALAVCAAPLLGCSALPTAKDTRVLGVYSSERIWNGVATTSDGRVFVCYPSFDKPGPQLQELKSSSDPVPWPDAAWNNRKPGGDLSAAFVHVNAVRIGPDGELWAVDAGAEGLGVPSISGAARLFRFNVSSGSLERAFALDAGLKPASFIDDVRFNGHHAYLTDIGSPGLLVLDLTSGAVRRVLDHDSSTTDQRPMIADGHVMRDPQGHELRVHADQIEVSPDGRYAYFQPASGPLARIETRWLDDPMISPSNLSSHVDVNWVNTPTCGGTAIDSDGNIYMGDAERRRILKISPDKTVTTLVADTRFIWTDAMWIDQKGFLWIPETQLNRVAALNNGKGEVDYPVWMLKMQIGARPPANDHP